MWEKLSDLQACIFPCVCINVWVLKQENLERGTKKCLNALRIPLEPAQRHILTHTVSRDAHSSSGASNISYKSSTMAVIGPDAHRLVMASQQLTETEQTKQRKHLKNRRSSISVNSAQCAVVPPVPWQEAEHHLFPWNWVEDALLTHAVSPCCSPQSLYTVKSLCLTALVQNPLYFPSLAP